LVSVKLWLRSLPGGAVLAAAAVLLVPGYVALRAYCDERRIFLPVRHEPRVTVARSRIPGLRDVSFSTPTGVVLRGVFAPSRNRAAVVLTHGSNGERSDVLPEARLLSQAGFGVLAFDWPGHCLSGGTIAWGAPERAALASALDFVAVQPGVDPARLGAFGFSMGGYITAQVAARDLRLRAVALASSPNDALEHLRWQHRQLGALRRWPALLALRVSGMNIEELVPQRVVGEIAPRPLLIIGGRDDQIVPNWMTEKLFAAAGEPKQLLLLPNAGHGGFLDSNAAHYSQQLISFFNALLR
jgi:alpha-beta hydrolase superfamily lysophospholipase